MAAFELLRDNEPRGDPYGEPRDDGLYVDEEHDCWRNEDGDAVCGARRTTASYDWARCRNTTTKASGRCRHHGGDTPRGQNNPNTKHGKYSKALPDQVASRYESVRTDEHLTDLREEIAVIETRLHLTLESLDYKDTSQLWGDVAETFTDLRAAIDRGDSNTVQKMMRQLNDLIERGASDRSKWEEIGNLIERKRRLVDSERRREKALQEYVPIEEFILSMHTLHDVLRRHIDDPKKLQSIARELRDLFDLG